MYCSFFDVDGVLLDFEDGFMKAIKDYFQFSVILCYRSLLVNIIYFD